MKYKVSNTYVEAKQWFKDGDQPDMTCYNYIYRYPLSKCPTRCTHCQHPLNVHAHLDIPHAGFIICPKSWIIVPPEIDGKRPPPFVVYWMVFDAIYEKMED